MAKLIDITGHVFGRWTVVRRSDKSQGARTFWECKCVCGSIGHVQSLHLRKGFSTSCGCFSREVSASRMQTHGYTARRATGLKRPHVYRAWRAMIDRCTLATSIGFHNYGGRGIAVCLEWRSFEPFLWDMGDPPSPQHSLDRIDTEGNYCKENCRWATRTEQGNNRRNNRVLFWQGEYLTMAQWTARYGFHVSTIPNRLNLGWSLEDIFTTPVRRDNRRRRAQ